MAEAYKCDRCGKFYDKNKKVTTKGRISGGIITGIVTTSKGDKDEWFDLCDDCIIAFKEFMNGKEVHNVER